MRGKKVSAGTLLDETLDQQSRIERLNRGLDAFLARVTGTAATTAATVSATPGATARATATAAG